MKRFTISDYQPTSADGFTKRTFLKSPNGLVFTLNLQPGQEVPSHTHGASELLVTTATGEGEATVNGQTERIKPGVVLHCDGSDTFGVRNTGSSLLTLMVVLYPGDMKFAGDLR